MNESTLENVQPELQPNSEQKTMDSTSATAIGNTHNVMRRLSAKNSLRALEKKFEEMSNPNIVESLKEQFNRDGYKAGFCDGFRLAIEYVRNGA